MKQRFSSLDVKIIAHELSASLVSLRLANVYDLSSRIFLLKFAKPDHREQLLIDSGFRCHLTSFARATAAAPSPFVARLRKFLRTRRVTGVSQVGTDRVIEIQFSDGAYRLFLEFYAGGNIILTDAECQILALLRNVNEGEEHEQYRLGLKYDLSLRQNYGGVPELTKERVRKGLEKAVQRQAEEAKKAEAKGKKKGKKAGADALRKALAVTTTEFPPVLLEHALKVAGFERETPVERVLEDDAVLEKLMEALGEAGRTVKEITSEDTARGYILAKRKPGVEEVQQDDEGEGSREGLLYDDFHPFKPAQFADDSSLVFLEHQGFNKTVDEFFSSIEGQKLESRLQEREDAAKRKIEQARQEQAKRIDGLQQVQELNVRKAQAIEANVERMEEAAAAVNGLIAQGMDWEDIGHLIENEQKRNNPVAELIKLPLKLQENTITLLLSEPDSAADEDMLDETDSEASDSEAEDAATTRRPAKIEDKRLSIDVDLALSGWANARQYYDQRKTAAVKQEKTAQASEKALKSTEQKVMADLKKGLKQEKDVLRPVRKQMWFEKFTYFISSDGYLVLAGKDAQQNEMLYRRYLKKGDVYVHADLHGAASVIIKNNPATPEAPIPPSTLSQAGNLSVCSSTAWDSKAVMSAWWVNSDQVSKTAPTGEYLTTGGFMIRGKKNFLPPAQLLLGFAVVFRISEESKAKHVKNRYKDADVSATTDKMETVELGGNDDEDDEDDFPDAAQHAEGDDDDFPDAKSVEHTEEDDDYDDDESPDARFEQGHDEDEGNAAPRSNPLQTNGASAGAHADEDDEEDDSEEEDTPEEKHENGSAAGSKEDAGASADESGAKQPGGIRHLSARERRTQRKGGQGDPQSDTDSKSQTPSIQQMQKGPQQKPRGKRGKAKKIAAKYANQDEEDRELAMQLLGSRAQEEKRKTEEEASSKVESAEAARARRRAQHEKAQKEGLEAEEIRRLNLEEGVDALDEEEASALTELDSLVGTPLPGDEILEAIPMCAPWSALGKYKYRAKMQPGQQKKGKAVREILGKWVKDSADPKKVDQSGKDNERIWPREAELVKGWKDVEVVGVIPVKSVRVMMGGGGGGGVAGPNKKQRGQKRGKGSKKK